MLLLCLAKSRKHGGRCVAGVEVVSNGSRYRVVRQAGEPRWVRPVAAGDTGAVPAHLVDDISLLDVVEFTDLRPSPQGYQSENFLLGTRRPQVVDSLPKVDTVLRQLVTHRKPPMFGNCGKAVPAERIDELDHSLLLLRAESPVFQHEETSTGRRQLRVGLRYGSRTYDLPVTDPEFEKELERTGPKELSFSLCYLTISLGLRFEGWHYKLVAGVFLVP
jgi:hypothetical protein